MKTLTTIILLSVMSLNAFAQDNNKPFTRLNRYMTTYDNSLKITTAEKNWVKRENLTTLGTLNSNKKDGK